MTIDSHVRFALSGLLDGPVDPDAVASWPTWAREHLRVCPECLSLLDAQRELLQALAVVSEAAGRQRRLPGPSARRERLARRQVLPPDLLAAGRSGLPRRALRGEGNPLELVRTSRGVRLWHRDATEVLVLAAGDDLLPTVVRHARDDTPGISLDLELCPARGAHVLAVASAEPLEPRMWLLWLSDALAAGRIERCVAENASDFVNLAHVVIPPPLRASLLRLRSDALPEATAPVTALLRQAAHAGREDRVLEATNLYERALEAAFSTNDETGQVKAAMGLCLALRGLGYEVDADRVLRWLIENHVLDATWGGAVCRQLATHALNQMDVEAAERWVEDAERLEGPDAEWVQVVRLHVAAIRRQEERACSLAQSLSERALPDATHACVRLHHAMSLVRAGDAPAGRGLVEALSWPANAPLEVELLRSLFDVTLCAAEGDRGRLPSIVESVRTQVATKDGAVLSSWDHPPLLQLAVDLRRAGQPEAALDLFRLRFLDSERAADRNVRLLGLAASYEGLLLGSPNGHPRLRSLGWSREQFRDLVAQARDELRGEDRLTACRTLGSLLFAEEILQPGPLWVGSDGLLVEAPLRAAAVAVLPEGTPPPAMRELVGIRRPPPERAEDASSAIVSLADAQGDLPWAAREVERREAALWLRGKAVTRRRLLLSAPVGLLHLGLHARREQGVPQLLFADGPLGPVEIAATPLPGAPVVLLAGCATGVSHTAAGVERSLADAFLRAGASAVIGTLWPVEDREILPFVRALVEAWPFQDVAATVASICLRLRQQGLPARCWAAPMVY